MDFSEKLKNLRKEYQLSQEQVADKIGVSRQAITKWEIGGGLPDIENLISIAALFQISVDNLLSRENIRESADLYIYESITEYDIDVSKHYDFHIGDAHEIIIQGNDTEKLKVRLASKQMEQLESKYKVKLDDHKNRLDLNVINNNVSKMQTKEELCIMIYLPQKFLAGFEMAAAVSLLKIINVNAESLEFGGKVSKVQICSFQGKLELDCSCDMEIICDHLCGQIDVNQISAASIIHIPSGTQYHATVKGRSNRLQFTRDGKIMEPVLDAEADNGIELSGIKSELIIDEYTRLPDAAREASI